MIEFDLLKDEKINYELLYKWCSQEEIYKYFEQRPLSYDEIVDKYYPRTLKDTKIVVYMIEYDKKLVGMIQYQKVDDKKNKLYGINLDNAYEIDLFIGELDLHNKSIGKETIDKMCDYLFNEKKADYIIGSILDENIKSLKCCEKCGFKILKKIRMKDTIGVMQNYYIVIKNKE